MNDVRPDDSHAVTQRATPEITLSHLDTLPTLSAVAVRLLQVTADADSSAADVVQTLKGDQSLTARILQLANSPIMGARSKVTTLERAVVLLGFKAVRNVALAVKVFEALPPGTGRAARFDPAEFWKHSLGVASAAQRLARARPELKVDPDEAFVAGLLHDLGKVALNAVFPKAYERIVTRAEETRADIADCERAVLGVDHTVAGRHLAKRWGLPDELQEVIWLHHVSPETLSESVAATRLIAVVQLANEFVREQHIGYSGDFAYHEGVARLAEYLGVQRETIDEVIGEVVADVAEYCSILGLDRETPETLYLQSLTRANQELSRLNIELLGRNRRLSAGARYFRAITDFDRLVGAGCELSNVVEAIAETAAKALQREKVAVFGVHDRAAAIELAWLDLAAEQRELVTLPIDDELREWLAESHELIDVAVTRAPRAVRLLVARQWPVLRESDAWLLPILCDERVCGGIVFGSQRDERVRLAPEGEELRCYLTSLGYAITRVNAQAAARRLSESLAESNRRLQQMQTEILRSRALSMIAEMAAGAGHELNSPLTVISGRAQMLLGSTTDPELRRVLQQIFEKAHECAHIVTELMDFARPQPPALQATDVPALLEAVRSAWLEKSGLPPTRLLLDLPEGGSRLLALADPDQIRCVLDEIVANAIDAISENEGQITLACREGTGEAVERAEAALRLHFDSQRKELAWVEIVVRDTGCGMTPAVAQRIFDPFFSHRRAGRGRGLGLARAHRIVDAHGGRIWVVSQPGEGSAFHILLPQAGAQTGA